jgi:hypothetical protein
MATPDDLRRAALARPEAVEVDHFGAPSWRVNGKIFAQLTREPGRAILKLPKDRQILLFELRPEVFAPAVWGRLTWSFVTLDAIAAEELDDLVETAWRLVAPKGRGAAKAPDMTE